MIAHNETKRIRMAEPAITKAEMDVTSAVNHNNLTPVEIEQLLQAHLNGLRNTIAKPVHKNAGYSEEL